MADVPCLTGGIGLKVRLCEELFSYVARQISTLTER